METQQISIPRLRMAELHAFTEEAIKVCKPHAMLAAAVNKVENLFSEFGKSFIKQQASAKEKVQLDRDRDKLLSGFFYAVRSAGYFPYTGQALETCKTLQELAYKYKGIARLSQNEETAQIDSLLSELGQINLESVKECGIQRWLPLINDANKAFKDATSEFISDSASAKQQSASTEIAPQLNEALNAMATMFYAFLTIQPTPELEKSYVQLSVLADSYR